jgi:hypothetical protein
MVQKIGIQTLRASFVPGTLYAIAGLINKGKMTYE